MTTVPIEEIVDHAVSLGGVLVLRPGPGDGSPEISWGDVFLYYAPDGRLPTTQPFATIVTKDYPGEEGSGLDRPGAFRLNVGVGATVFREVLGHDPHDAAPVAVDPSAVDVPFPHPAYGRLGWLCVVDPGERTRAMVLGLLTGAHAAARRRHQRRHAHDAD